MLTHICSFLVVIPPALLCLFPMKNQLKKPLRQILMWMALVLVIIIPISAFLIERFCLKTNTILLPMMILLYMAYHYSLTVSIAKSLSVFIWVSGLMAIFSNYANGVDAILHPTSGADIESIEFVIVQLGISILTGVLLYYPVSKYGSFIIDNFHYDRIWFLTIPFSLLFWVVNLLVRPLHYETLFIGSIFRAFWVTVTTTLVMWIMLSAIFYFIVSGVMKAIKTRDRAQYLELQESQFISQQEYMEESARVRHDFKQMIRTLQELLAAKDYDAAEDFVNKYAEALPENEITRYCINPALNALLNYYARIADNEGIQFNLWIDIPAFLPLSDVELCGMVGNILENGIAACKRMKEGRKWIQLTILLKNANRLYIVATNSFDGEVRIKDGHYLSTKRRGRGLGLESITAIVERYNGSVRFSHTESDFYTDVVIPLPEKDLEE